MRLWDCAGKFPCTFGGCWEHVATYSRPTLKHWNRGPVKGPDSTPSNALDRRRDFTVRKYLWLAILPLFLYWFGYGCNILVITVNHGTMPVAMPVVNAYECFKVFGRDFCRAIPPGTMLDPVHATWSSGVRLAALADWIQLPGIGTCSVGDLLIWLSRWMQPYCIGGWMALSLRDFPAVPRD